MAAPPRAPEGLQHDLDDVLDAPSAPRRAPPSLLPWLGVAAVGHVAAAGGLMALAWIFALLMPAPALDPEDIIEVTMMMSPPAPEFSAVPRNATKVAAAPAAEAAAAAPAPTAAPEPPPPVQSEMVAPNAPPPSPTTTPPPPDAAAAEAARKLADQARAAEADRKRQEAMRQLAMEGALDELAEDGDRNQRAGGPTVDPNSNATQVWGPGMGDAELQRYIAQISKLMRDNFHPLPALTGQGLQVKLIVDVDDAGRVLKATVSKTSGNPSYDQAARQAAINVGTVPPPPAKYRDGQANRYFVTFSDGAG